MGVMILARISISSYSYRIVCGQSKFLIRFFQKINMPIPHHKSDVKFQERPVLPNFTFKLFLKTPKCFFQKSSSETFTFFFEIILALTFIYSFFIVKKQEIIKEVKILKTKPQLEKKFKFPECSFKEKSKLVIFTLNFIVATGLKKPSIFILLHSAPLWTMP